MPRKPKITPKPAQIAAIPPRGRGRPAYEPTKVGRRAVESMTAGGIPQHEIARVLQIDEKTLRLHFFEELAVGQTRANAKVAQALYRRALTEKGSAGVTAAIFWLKMRAGWVEPKAEDLPGKKARAEADAAHAVEQSDWHELLN